MTRDERIEEEDAIKAEAKRLDKVLSKYKKGNGGIVTAKNFMIAGKTVTLQGQELGKVGTGYSGVGESTLERVKSIVDQVEADLEHIVDKMTGKEKKDAIDHTITDEDLKNNPGLEKDVKVGDTVQLPAEGQDLSTATHKELLAICKDLGIKPARGAKKADLIALIDEHEAEIAA